MVTLAEVGGAQSYVRDLLPAVSAEFDVTVAAHGDGPLRAAAAEAGAVFVPLHNVRRPISLLRDPLALIELGRLFRRLRPDIVHLNSSKVGILGRIAAAVTRVPVRIFTAHGWAFKATAGPAAWLYLWADRAVRPLATMIVCVSENEREKGLQARVCVQQKSIVIRNAVELGPSPTHAARSPKTIQIVSVGRLARPKDFSTLLKAVALLRPRNVQLTVLGDGPLREQLEREIIDLGLADIVDLAGEVEDVRARLAKADVFALSSTSEGMPLSVLEAMAAGLPVVVSAVDGITEVVVDSETGLLATPGRALELAERLGRLVDDPQLRARLGQAGRRRAEELFSVPRWHEEHLALYHSLREIRYPGIGRGSSGLEHPI